jgi:hypothetical protein
MIHYASGYEKQYNESIITRKQLIGNLENLQDRVDIIPRTYANHLFRKAVTRTIQNALENVLRKRHS